MSRQGLDKALGLRLSFSAAHPTTPHRQQGASAHLRVARILLVSNLDRSVAPNWQSCAGVATRIS